MGGRGGGGRVSLSASSINQVSALSADSTSGRWTLSYGRGAHVYKQRGGGGGGGGAIRGGGRHSVPKGGGGAMAPPGDALELYTSVRSKDK